jgi:hypothetical protein
MNLQEDLSPGVATSYWFAAVEGITQKPAPNGAKECPAGDIVNALDRAHTLHFGSVFWVLKSILSSRRAGGMWESPPLRFPHFPRLACRLIRRLVLRQTLDMQTVAIEAGQREGREVYPLIALVDGSAKTALVGDRCSPAREDKSKELNGALKGAPLQNTCRNRFFQLEVVP